MALHIQENADSLYLGENPTTDSKYYGKLYYKNGTSYQGYFVNNKKHGYGEERNSEGYSKGYYADDKLHGKAVTYLKNKQSYVDGYYNQGKLNGECLFYDDKSIIVNKGMYKDGKSCVASYEIVNSVINGKLSKVYEGYMYEDKYNGFGKLYESDRVYIGNFTTGKKDGKFLVCYLDGTMAYSPQTNIDIIIDIEKVNRDNFTNYKNTVTFNNDMFDDEHKIVHKCNITKSVKYIGKFNMDLQYHDDSGVYYENTNTYSGKFVSGQFISGSSTFANASYKGDFNGFKMNGQGTVLFSNGYKFIGNFINNKSELGIFMFKYNTKDTSIKCKLIFTGESVLFETEPNTTFNLDEINKYVGNFKIGSNMNSANDTRLTFTEGKHYINDVLVYEGEFNKHWKYNGSGMKFHKNGSMQMTGLFEQGEPLKCDYYDEDGNLFYSDIENDYGGSNMTNMQNNQIYQTTQPTPQPTLTHQPTPQPTPYSTILNPEEIN
jgi:hypothetical protein